MLTLSGKEKHNTVGFLSTALLQERLNAKGTPGTQGGLLIYTPALGRAMCPAGIGQSAGTLICMHPLRRGWRQIRASACAVVLFTETVYRRLAPSFRHQLSTAIPSSSSLTAMYFIHFSLPSPIYLIRPSVALSHLLQYLILPPYFLPLLSPSRSHSTSTYHDHPVLPLMQD